MTSEHEWRERTDDEWRNAHQEPEYGAPCFRRPHPPCPRRICVFRRPDGVGELECGHLVPELPASQEGQPVVCWRCARDEATRRAEDCRMEVV